MLETIGLVLVGFAAGVPLTSLVAAYLLGALRAEAVRAIESYGGLFLTTSVPPAGSAPHSPPFKT